ncbi:putative Oxygen-independent coproporphyrinogen III oxidase [Candidatus Nitrospira inopinata]|jgi:oxygen-independent coproporphyrinogen-3 oxidase|uniref:Heme chaperone HemW n=2 Tax=Candidatus Nitrospira inopinata TaxID=1715989 RepID=A0A0S4KZV1_9BACT|nr:putative Oxygen-independent coproporphyrinogen III oxidase [Candidatus Nitrospira inopinata]
MTMRPRRPIGVYIHVPFCRQRCHFCAFYLEAAKPERMEAFCSALAREIDFHDSRHVTGGRPLRSLYIGGGTPTTLPATQLVAFLKRAQEAWSMEDFAEITVEAHPSTVTLKDLSILAEAGFNRLSMGAESMDQRDFIPIGRPGLVDETERAVKAARAAGFRNVNLDLMYGLPGQTLESWMDTLQATLALEPTHVSCYALTVEEGTRLARDIAKNLIPPPNEALQVEMESAAEAFLQAAGFERYELSNYALPGFACRHNKLYWTDGDYLGLGPSAQSYVNGVRFGNIDDLTAYVDCLSARRLPVAERTELTDGEQRRDALVFGLRLIEGVPLRVVRPGTPQHRALTALVGRGFIEWKEDHVRLTRLGRRYADSVAEQLY